MRLLILSGFLGSGKTTLLLEIIRKLSVNFKKMAIIENEIGDIGIDGKYLQLQGLEVRELFGGCICCTLSVDLLSTLKKLDQLFHPEMVIIEASGIANPSDIVNNINRYWSGSKSMMVLTVVDASRYMVLIEMMTPLLSAQIKAAEIIALNKIDMVDNKTIAYIAANIAQFNENSPIINISAEEKINIETLLEKIS